MATYKEVRGTKIRDYTTNPDNPIEGQVWYNETDNVAKYEIPNQTAAWRTINSLNTGRYHAMGTGTITNGLVSGGNDGSATGATEEWSGTSNTIKVLTD